MPVEDILERHLGPVTAPGELWDRIQTPSAPRPQPGFRLAWRKLAWTAAALLAVAGVVSSFRTPYLTAANEAAALQALARGPGDLEFQSGKAGEIRAWIRTGTGMDVPLPDTSSPQVRLEGARLASAGTVEIAYEVGGQRAALLVSKGAVSGPAKARHGELNRDSLQSRQTYSWTLSGQQYTLACSAPGELQAACQLCHVDSQWQTAMN